MPDGFGQRLRRAVGRRLGIDDGSTRASSAARPVSGDDRAVRRDPDAVRDAGGERQRGAGVAPPHGTRAYPGDFVGVPAMAYAPKPDGQPDPGEIVWTWVPFEEDHAVGKDRPVLVIGSDGDWLLGVMLTSRDHDRDAAQEHRAGRDWVDVGTGAWDRAGRPSEVRTNRVIRVDPTKVRREGSVLPEDRFDAVAEAIRQVA